MLVQPLRCRMYMLSNHSRLMARVLSMALWAGWPYPSTLRGNALMRRLADHEAHPAISAETRPSSQSGGAGGAEARAECRPTSHPAPPAQFPGQDGTLLTNDRGRRVDVFNNITGEHSLLWSFPYADRVEFGGVSDEGLKNHGSWRSIPQPRKIRRH